MESLVKAGIDGYYSLYVLARVPSPEHEVRRCFEKFGTVVEVRYIRDHTEMFVRFLNKNDAVDCLSQMMGHPEFIVKPLQNKKRSSQLDSAPSLLAESSSVVPVGPPAQLPPGRQEHQSDVKPCNDVEDLRSLYTDFKELKSTVNKEKERVLKIERVISGFNEEREKEYLLMERIVLEMKKENDLTRETKDQALLQKEHDLEDMKSLMTSNNTELALVKKLMKQQSDDISNLKRKVNKLQDQCENRSHPNPLRGHSSSCGSLQEEEIRVLKNNLKNLKDESNTFESEDISDRKGKGCWSCVLRFSKKDPCSPKE